MSVLPGARKLTTGLAPPPGYQAGVGRGASGFSTRGDFGVAETVSKGTTRPATTHLFGPSPPGYVPGHGRGATGFAGGVSRDDTVDDRVDYTETNYDEFSGYSEGLFGDVEYDEEDRHADFIYDQIEQKMDTRRRSRREAKLKTELSKLRASKPTINQQFADLKRKLVTVSKEEWESIPDIGDYTIKNKQKKTISSIPAPDSLLLNNYSMSQTIGSIDTRAGIGGGTSTPIGLGLQTPVGLQTPLGIHTPLGLYTSSVSGTTTSIGGYRTPLTSATPSLNDLGEARGTVLSVKLDKVMDNVSGQTVIDPKGYLTDLNSLPVSTDAHMADLKKARLLLRSVIQTNPNHVPGWIAAARLEELGGKLQEARELIAEGCLQCPKNEDIWLEASRLEKEEEAKAILANGIKHNPHSVKLWQEAANNETNPKRKKLTLWKALQFVPDSVRLWKEAISLEEPKTAITLLKRAVECVPQSVEIWLALARLSTYQEAQKVLNQARKQIPTSVDIWLSAAKLEESQKNLDMVSKIIPRAIENLSSKGVNLDRDHWLKHAEESEKSMYPYTCEHIIKHTMSIGVEEINQARIWISDAENALARGRIVTSRSLYVNALQRLHGHESIWIALARLEMQYGTAEAVADVLKRAVDDCPGSEVLWLMAAKQKLMKRDVNSARILLADAFRHVESKEAVSLVAVKLERENGEYERARVLLNQARIRCDKSSKVWIQSIKLERMLENYVRAIELVNEALKVHPKCEKIWMMAAQLQLEKNEPDEEKALSIFEQGLKECPKSVNLWISLVSLYLKKKEINRARAILEKARLKNSHNELLWLETIKIELIACDVSETEWHEGKLGNKNIQIPHHMMAKALQECPQSGILWAEAIFLESPNAQNAKSVDALTQCENDPNVILAVAKLFLNNEKIVKARRWMNRAVILNPLLGDAWGAFLRLEILHGQDQNRIDVIKRCTASEPKTGLLWNSVVKNPKYWKCNFAEKLRIFIEHIYPNTFKVPLKHNIGEDVFDLLYARVQEKDEGMACKEDILKEDPQVKEEEEEN